MKTYKVQMDITFSQNVYVEANSAEEAEEKAKDITTLNTLHWYVGTEIVEVEEED